METIQQMKETNSVQKPKLYPIKKEKKTLRDVRPFNYHHGTALHFKVQNQGNWKEYSKNKHKLPAFCDAK